MNHAHREDPEEADPRERALDATARVANAVAHGLNNQLMALSGYAELVRDRLEPDHPAHATQLEVMRAVERLAEATHRLVGYARKLRLDPRAVDLGPFLAQRLGVLARLAGEAARFEGEVPTGLRALVDPTALEEALATLLHNARDATDGKGRITLAVDRDPGAPFARFTLTDDGPGLDPEVRRRLFEPYVTTWARLGSSGLGLAWLRGMAKQSGGDVRLESAPGGGVTAVLRIPLAGPSDRERPEGPWPEGRGETVLVVDDERTRRRTAAAVLAGAGYAPVEREGAAEALTAIEQMLPPVAAAVLTAFPLEGMDGGRLAERMAQMRPGLPVVLIQGRISWTAPPGVVRQVLRRPYGWGDLARALRAALAGR